MQKLYIDFDGVILDTIETTYKIMDNLKIDKKNETEVIHFFQYLDWQNILLVTPVINDSINCIKRIKATNKYDISILTHVNSYNEIVQKIKYINKYLPGINIIVVPKEKSKTKMVDPRGAILIDDYKSNLREWKEKGGIAIKFSKKMREYPYPIIDRLDKILEM